LDSIPIWIRMSRLPAHLWNEKCFQAIENHLGEFLATDMGFIDSGEMVVTRILVLLNIREGLKECLNLTYFGRTRVKILDYEGVHFRCRRCHEYGHIIKECKSSSKGHRTPRSTSENRQNNEIPTIKDTSSPSTESSTGGNTTSEQATTRTEEVEDPLTQGGNILALVPAVRETSASKAGTEVVPQFLVDSLLGMHITISRSANGFFKDYSFSCLNGGLPRLIPPPSSFPDFFPSHNPSSLPPRSISPLKLH